ncbi:hypothetical protein DL240_06695 [Lujinxingia litoralis]|uniref:Uncharacterized protein n=2 Tax=Lujinxingia litoralis TaxID=2211119 RepID=A0A328C797_9DELT|nr:hypothetical protein DL240_06695 [Lujinxingia litoralis]
MVGAGCTGDAPGGTNGLDAESGTDVGGQERDAESGGDVDSDPDAQDVAEDGGPDSSVPDTDPGPDEEDYPPVACAYPSDDAACPQGPYGPGSLFSKFEIVTDKTCCADLNGDDRIDNFLGADVVGALGPFLGGDVNGNIALAIERGLLMYLMEARDWGNTAFDSALELKVLEGDYSVETPTTNLAGEGSVVVSAESYEGGEPRFAFASARVDEGGTLRATGGKLNAAFPGMLDAIVLELTDVQIRARVVEDPPADLQAGGGFGLMEGELAGVLLRDRFFESMNEAALACECIQDTPLLFTYDGAGNNDRYVCELEQSDVSNCNNASAACKTLANSQLCHALGLLSGAADVDTEEGRAFSIGVRFETVPTELQEAP